MTKRSLATLLCTSLLSTPLWAQDNIDKLTNMQKTDATFTYVDQEGETADALTAILEHVNVPDGFEVSLYAVVPDARSMSMAPQGTVLFAGTRKDKVWSIVDRDRNRVADEVKDFAPSITFDIPMGLASRPTGSFISPNATAFWFFRPPSSSLKARTSQWVRSSPKAN